MSLFFPFPFRPQQLLFIWILLWSPWKVSGDLCLEVCAASTTQEDQHKFTFEGKEVFCAEEVCLVRPMKYKVYELSNPSPEVSFEVKLLRLTGVKFERNELDLGMWLSMSWHDPRLKLCACGKAGKELGLEQEVPAGTRMRAKMQKNLEKYIWTPDFTVKERAHSVRREGNLLDFVVEGDEGNSGVDIGFTVNLRVAVKCKYKTRDYPFNKNNCPVTIVPYNHEHEQSVKFVIRNMTMRNILYKDMKVDVCPQLREDGEAAKNGFMVVLDRRGGGEFRTYEFTMRVFVVTAILAVALSPRYTDVSFIGEAVLTGFYIDFDLYNKSPPVAEEDGGRTLLEEVTRVYYYLVFCQSVICISLRFLIRRLQQNFPLIRESPLVKKFMMYLPLVGIIIALFGGVYIDYKVNDRLARQIWDKCEENHNVEEH